MFIFFLGFVSERLGFEADFWVVVLFEMRTNEGNEL
jgi:hypothetical protein